MTRIWLNHWFSTAYNIINLIKENETDFYIIGSNQNINSVVECVCDEWYQEPVFDTEKYVEFCIDFCKEHKIDIFMPHREMVEISKNIDRFLSIGTKVMVDDYEIISVLNQKNLAYQLFKDKGIGIVPEFEIVTNADEFINVYQKMSKKYKQVCFKFVNDEGGKSFRLIDNTPKGYSSLFCNHSTRMALDDVVSALNEKEKFEPIIVMPYLPDEEISVDCLKTSQGIIALPRIKGTTRIEKFRYDKQIIDICNEFYEKVGLEYPCNIQFKCMDGIPYFLEVNTRMSGGIQMSCLASGVNIPNIAVNKMLGIEKEWHIEQTEKLISYIETPVIL